MKNRSIAIVSALSLTAALIAPTGFAGSAAAASTEASPAITSQVAAAALTYPVAPGEKTLFLYGEVSITITPYKYATFQVEILDSNKNVISTMSYSGSSPYTLVKNDTYLGGQHTIRVTSNVQGAGGFYTNSSQ